MAKKFSLGKNERLKSRKLIEQLFNEGKVLFIPPYRISYLQKSINIDQGIPVLQFGIGVSSKNFKKAVDRNRVKRLTREAFRLQKTELLKKLEQKGLQLNIFFVYTSNQLPDFNTVRDKLNVILNKLILLIDENSSSNT